MVIWKVSLARKFSCLLIIIVLTCLPLQFRHVILLLCQFVNHLEVIRLPVYYPSQEEKTDPKLYANNIRRLMAREGDLVMSDIGLAEKRIYIAALNGNNSLPSVLHHKDD
ncbi:unnamed protein product [Linum tenue]|uniref:Uncharacterized protein n=1 Tax=Linum tenue TaxID=586396 RepID=A0AAV0NYI8_9ROSI|nr:unnamed protein product [Linum tenue]